MTGDLYVQSVTDHVPHRLLLRDHIAIELRGHIAERIGRGQPIDEVLERLHARQEGLVVEDDEYLSGTWSRRQTSGSVPPRTTKNWCTSFGRVLRFADLLPIAGTLANRPSVRTTRLFHSEQAD